MDNISKFFRLFIFILFFALFLYVAFSNVSPVTVSFHKFSYTGPLFVVIFVSFFLGCLVTYICSLIRSVKYKYKIMSLNKKVSSLEEKVKVDVSEEGKNLDIKEESIENKDLDLSKPEEEKNEDYQN